MHILVITFLLRGLNSGKMTRKATKVSLGSVYKIEVWEGFQVDTSPWLHGSPALWREIQAEEGQTEALERRRVPLAQLQR